MPRLDALVTKAGLAPSRERAQALILAGKVKVGGETVRKPDRSVAEGTPIAVDSDQEYASRGALKLGPALDRFGVEVTGRVCADIGASTGGFTDVLLRRGAARIYAIDVGRGLLHWRLRLDPGRLGRATTPRDGAAGRSRPGRRPARRRVRRPTPSVCAITTRCR